jgi:hypothetical protein
MLAQAPKAWRGHQEGEWQLTGGGRPVHDGSGDLDGRLGWGVASQKSGRDWANHAGCSGPLSRRKKGKEGWAA